MKLALQRAVSNKFGPVLKSVRIWQVRLRTCWWTVFLFIQELILYSFVKRKEVLIFGYFAKPLGYVCLPVPELLICLKLVWFFFWFFLIDWGKSSPLSDISLWICLFFPFFNKKPCFQWLGKFFFLFFGCHIAFMNMAVKESFGFLKSRKSRNVFLIDRSRGAPEFS